MTSSEFIVIVRRRWKIVLSAVLVALILAGGATFVVPREYTSSISLYISAQGAADNAQSAYQGSLLSQERVKSYTELLSDRRVATDVVERLRLPEAPEDVQRQISATAPQDSVLIRASVTDGDPDRAATLANAVGQSFVTLVSELELPVDQAGVPAVVARVVQPAIAEPTPTAPSVPVYLALGGLLGLVAGLVGAVLRHNADRAVRDRQQIEKVLDAPMLGASFAVDGADERGGSLAPVRDDPLDVDAEAFRKAHAALRFLDADHPVRSFVITSPSAAEGKTTAACNLALAAASSGLRVVLVDADLRRPSVASFFGAEGSVGLTAVLMRQISLTDAVQPSGFPNLSVLAAGNLPPNPGALLGSERMREVVAELERSFDHVVIDSAPVLPAADTTLLAPHADGVVVVVRHGATTTPALDGTVSVLQGVRARLLGGMITFHPRSGAERYGVYHQSYGSAEVAGPAAVPVRAPDRGRAVPSPSPSPRPEPGPVQPRADRSTWTEPTRTDAAPHTSERLASNGRHAPSPSPRGPRVNGHGPVPRSHGPARL